MYTLSLLLATVALSQLVVQDFERDWEYKIGVEDMGEMPLIRYPQTKNGLPLLPRDTLDSDDFDNAIEMVDGSPVEVSLGPGGHALYRFDFTTLNVSYISLYYFTANVIEYPLNMSRVVSDEALDDLFGLNLYINDTTYALTEFFDEGYASDIVYYANDYVALDGTFYVEPYFHTTSPYFKETDQAKFTFGFSSSELTYQWDNGTLADVVDTDGSSAFLQSEPYNVSADSLYRLMNETGFLKLRVFDEDGFGKVDGLLKSWAAITSAQTVIPDDSIQVGYRNLSGSYRLQLYVEGLDPSTTYYSILTFGLGNSEGSGIVYSPRRFTTQEAGICEFIYDLDFCSNVAYSVPRSNLTDNNRDLKVLYDAYAAAIYANFSLLMQQVSCDVGLDSRYSPIVTCEDCEEAYKNWLCSVTIPRCTTNSSSYFIKREAGEMRTEELQNLIQPQRSYYEVLPCIDMCNEIVRTCPASFGFQCPQDNDTILMMSYNYYKSDTSYDTCNIVGNSVSLLAQPNNNSAQRVLLDKKLWGLIAFTTLLVL